MSRGNPAKSVRFTGAEVASFFAVDPKTIHNWVARGALAGEYTEGGHLRVRRSAVLATAKRFGLPVPRAVLAPAVRVALAVIDATAARLAERALTPPSAFSVTRYAHPFDALVDFVRGEPEVLVVDPAEAAFLLALAAERMPHLPFPTPPLLVAFGRDDRPVDGYAAAASHAEPGKLRGAVLAVLGLGE